MKSWHSRLATGASGIHPPLPSLFGLLLAASLLAVAAPAAAQTDESAGQLEETVRETVSTRQDTQQRQDDWALEKSELTRRYRAARASVEWLEGRRADEQEKTAALEARITEMGRRLTEAQRLEASIQDSLMVILVQLEDSVRGGLPFLPTEREMRLQSVRRDLIQPDIPSAEKLRRLLEALQVEAGYASTVEVYQDRIEVAGQEIHADVLRLGRLSLFWRTPDGDRIGLYDSAAGVWAELPGKHERAISRAMEMATRMRPIELISLPLGRIEP